MARAVAEYIARLRAEHPEIVRAIWFGSWVTGIPTPGSDVDLCLIVTDSTVSPHERAVAYLPVGFPVGVDLFVYTVDGFAQLKSRSPSWYAAITSGREIK